jgi:hypothetical protein
MPRRLYCSAESFQFPAASFQFGTQFGTVNCVENWELGTV